jgi:hypothetical protein
MKQDVVSVDKYVVRIDTVVVYDIQYEKTPDSIRLSKKDGYLELMAVGRDTGLSYLRLKHADTLFRSEVNHRPLTRVAIL